MKDLLDNFAMTIRGERRTTAQGIEVINPAAGRAFAFAPDAEKSHLDDAVASAREAFRGWRQRPDSVRRDAVHACGTRLIECAGELAQILTREQGKPLGDAREEIVGAGVWCQAMASQLLPGSIVEDSADRLTEIRHVPIGVVGAIAPWNYPVILAFGKVASALVAGNSVVLKPSPYTPLTTLKAVELLQDILPPGVLNVVSGSDRLGPWLTEHEGIDKISFTGSTATGKAVMRSAATSLKRITLELGGNDPAIVLPDVDIDEIAPHLFWAAFRNSGQICMATKRLFVHDDIYDAIKDALVRYASTVRIGDGALEGVQLGPVQNARQFERVAGLIDDCNKRGLNFVAGGEFRRNAPGYFVPISIVDNPPDDTPVVAEEAFGPLLPVMSFQTIDDVIARANNSPYGLTASVWSKNVPAAKDVARQLDCGTVWINEVHHLTPLMPFGGHKQSGLGVESGTEGLLEYTNTQTLTTRHATAMA